VGAYERVLVAQFAAIPLARVTCPVKLPPRASFPFPLPHLRRPLPHSHLDHPRFPVQLALHVLLTLPVHVIGIAVPHALRLPHPRSEATNGIRLMTPTRTQDASTSTRSSRIGYGASPCMIGRISSPTSRRLLLRNLLSNHSSQVSPVDHLPRAPRQYTLPLVLVLNPRRRRLHLFLHPSLLSSLLNLNPSHNRNSQRVRHRCP